MAWFVAVVVAGCGGRASDSQHTDPDGEGNEAAGYEALDARVVEASRAWCEIAVDCYGPPEDATYHCFVPTSDGGYRAWSSGPACDPEVNACYGRLFEKYQAAYKKLRECQVTQANDYAVCLSSCPEVADACNTQYDNAHCTSEPELREGFVACLEEFC